MTPLLSLRGTKRSGVTKQSRLSNRGDERTLLTTPHKRINYEIATAVKDKGTAA